VVPHSWDVAVITVDGRGPSPLEVAERILQALRIWRR